MPITALNNNIIIIIIIKKSTYELINKQLLNCLTIIFN